MAVVNTKSSQVANGDAAVQTLNASGVSGGRQYVSVDKVAVAAADDDGSVLRMFRVHSSWRILQLELLCDALTGGTSYDLGLYQIAANGGAVVAAGCYANAVDLSAAKTAWLEMAFENRTIDKVGNAVWQDAGLSADNGRWYDLCLTANTIGTAAGNVAMKMTFTQGSS